MNDFKFTRLFSMGLFKNKKIALAQMSFEKDFINTDKGALYPIIAKSVDTVEEISFNRYCITKGCVSRFFCRFFPFATYEAIFTKNSSKAGFEFRFPHALFSISINNDNIIFSDGYKKELYPLINSDIEEKNLIITCRPCVFDVYQLINGKPEFLKTFSSELLADMNKEEVFNKTAVCLYCEGETVVKSVSSYIDSGVSIADIRPIKYENGDVIYENGRIYLTASMRMQEEMYQGVLSWIPGSAEFELCGALLYNSGDGYIFGDVAASLKFDRNERMWYLWLCSFSHGHVLAHAKFDGDPRFGVNIIDVELMESAKDDNLPTDFIGFEGDEDPDFYYDEDDKKWYMSICRLFNDGNKHYQYIFFESDNPFSNFKYIGSGEKERAQETGGSFVKIKGEKYFICGNSFKDISEYRVYGKDGMTNLIFDYPDGGFRGWGSIIPVKMGTRTRYFHITFDRHGGSNYTWSYGNIYVFEMM